MVRLMVDFFKESQKVLKEGISLVDIRAMPIITSLLKAKFEIPDEQVSKFDGLSKDMMEQFRKLIEPDKKGVDKESEEIKVVV
jgi:V/A-type H+-transporting ATPase subunit A